VRSLELEKHKFDTKWKFAVLICLLLFSGFLQASHAPMANEFIALIIGLVGGIATKQAV